MIDAGSPGDGIEDLLAHFAPDLLTPSQFNDLRRSEKRRGEKALMAGVIEQFMRDYQKPPGCYPADPESRLAKIRFKRIIEREWVTNPGSGPFSFDNCWIALEIDPAWARRGMMEFMRLVDAGERPLRKRASPRGLGNDAIRPPAPPRKRIRPKKVRRRVIV